MRLPADTPSIAISGAWSASTERRAVRLDAKKYDDCVKRTNDRDSDE